MLAIELTTGQKVQVAFIAVILATAGYFIFRATRPNFDLAVNCSVYPKYFAVDPKLPMSPANGKNPRDPKKDQMITEFDCADGRLFIIEYLHADPPRPPTLSFTPETRIPGREYQYYQDPMAPVAKLKDPSLRHALAYATYNTIYKKPLGLLGKVGLTPEQIQQEGDARKIMNDAIKNIDASIENGTYQIPLMDKVMAALKVYKDKSGDPKVDTAKADLARKVLLAATNYLKQVQHDKNIHIDKYMAFMENLLTADQQQKLIDAVKLQTRPAQPQPAAPVARRGLATNPAGARAGRGATGPAGARGARGAVTTVPGN